MGSLDSIRSDIGPSFGLGSWRNRFVWAQGSGQADPIPRTTNPRPNSGITEMVDGGREVRGLGDRQERSGILMNSDMASALLGSFMGSLFGMVAIFAFVWWKETR